VQKSAYGTDGATKASFFSLFPINGDAPADLRLDTARKCGCTSARKSQLSDARNERNDKRPRGTREQLQAISGGIASD